MNRLEAEVIRMAMDDYRQLVAKKKCYDPEDIVSEVKFCQGECGATECDNNFVILTLGGTGLVDVEIGRYQFRCNEDWEILGIKRLYAQLFRPIEFHAVKKLNI